LPPRGLAFRANPTNQPVNIIVLSH
jgi:hypothetical protein